MDTILRSERCFSSIEVNGPFAKYDDLVSSLAELHPYRFDEMETLHYYDGPIITIGFVGDDPRARLDVLIDDDRRGPDGRHVFVTTRHQLVFDRLETLEATLSGDAVPTTESYRMADEIVRYRSICTQIGHDEPSYSMITSVLRWQDIPEDEMPYATQMPQGTATPSTRARSEA